MTYPMPPELLEQLGPDPRADPDPPWLEDHDALGWGRRVAKTADLYESAGLDRHDWSAVDRGR